MTKASEIRRAFLKFFEREGHRAVQSSPLVPANDPTLLFANAGMNQFKDVFLGKEKRDYSRACSSQKCVRAGGKHNDLENVGRTARHHTFFEMLGNFSFGDYFKAEAVRFAWDLITREFGLDKGRLTATVYRDDDEAFGLWKRVAGLPDSRILRLGEKDNFWAMGDTGPCGPCSEILYDLGESPAGHPSCEPDCDCGRHLEIWNLVFMQFERDESGAMSPLPSPSIDTGMGLERAASVIQGKTSNYDTDLFMPIIGQAEEKAGAAYGDAPKIDVSLRIIADHARAGAFLVTDGVVPSNEGRGYVLRKILRRAIRHGKILGIEGPFLHQLTSFTAELMGPAYPDLLEHKDYASRVVRNEEEQFSATLEFGLRKLEEVTAKGPSISGADVFRLYDTFGFPVDILEEIATEKGWSIDLGGFRSELDKQKERARASWKGEAQKSLSADVRSLAEGAAVEFVGYETLAVHGAVVTGLLVDDARVDVVEEGLEGEISLDRTPFYAESGGQVGDRGVLRGEGFTARVLDVRSPAAGVALHRVKVLSGEVREGLRASAEVDAARRRSTAANHTATHLLHAALRQVLGRHVKQAGSLVSPDRLRFDFTHFAAATPRELSAVEEIVNERIWLDEPVSTMVTSVEEAVEGGAMALFGEKYHGPVRVVGVGDFSKELCGGTHLARTGQAGVFKVVSEGGIAAGIRRVEALTGVEAYRRFVRDEGVLDLVHREFKVEADQLSSWIGSQLEEAKRLCREVERLRLKNASRTLDDIASRACEVGGVTAFSGVVSDVDRQSLRQLAGQLLGRHPRSVAALGAEIDGKAALVVMVTPDESRRFPAGKIVAALASKVDGSGGGKPSMAEAGGRSPQNLPEATSSLESVLRAMSQTDR